MRLKTYSISSYLPARSTVIVQLKESICGSMDNPHNESSIPLETNSMIPIVAIGASAGGIEALEIFFKHMPTDSGAAFAVIQHLDPKHKSILAELIQRLTRMEVKQVENDMLVEP